MSKAPGIMPFTKLSQLNVDNHLPLPTYDNNQNWVGYANAGTNWLSPRDEVTTWWYR